MQPPDLKPTVLQRLLNALGHEALRPVLIGVFGFALLNLALTAGVTFSPLNQRFNFKYGNFLPAKLQMLKAHHPEQTNVLFLGTSQTNNGFIPSVFDRRFGHGAHSFNVGLPNNHYDIMLAYLRFHQRQFGKPQMLLLELSPSIQEKNASQYYLPALYYRTLIEQSPALAGTYLQNPLLADNVKQELLGSSWSTLRQYRYTFSPVNVLGKVGNQFKSVTNRFSGLHDATANAEILNPTDESLTDNSLKVTEVEPDIPTWVTDEMLSGGWYPKSRSEHMKTPEGIQRSVVEARKYYIDQQRSVNFEKLEALLQYCRQQEIPVVLVSWPNHPQFLKVFQSSRLHAQYEPGVQRILKQYPVMMVNLNHHAPGAQSPNTAGYFADPRHLTPEGARYFSDKLAGLLSGGNATKPN